MSSQKPSLLAPLLFIIFFLPAAVSAQSQGPLIFGVGIGVFTIILAGIIALIICIVGNATPYPLLVGFAATLLPIVVFIFFYFAPTESQLSQDITTQTDTIDVSFGWRVAFFVLEALGMLIALLFLFLEFCTNIVRAPRVDSGAFLNLKEITEAANLKEKALMAELLPESPNRSFEGRSSAFNQDPQAMPPAGDEGITRSKRRFIDTGMSQPVEADESRSLIRRRLDNQ